MTKTYTHQNVTYGAKGRRWEFNAPGYSYATPTMPGGKETAHKVARVIGGAVKRCGSMDNLGRANLAKIFHQAGKPSERLVVHTPRGVF